MPKHLGKIIVCKGCGKSFANRWSHITPQYCSDECRQSKHGYQRIPKVANCVECGKEYKPRANSVLKSGKRIRSYTKSCSKECGLKQMFKHRVPKELRSNYNPFREEDLTARTSKLYNETRFKCFKRSNFKCEVCGKYDRHLNAHHLLSFKHYVALRYELINLVTLCPKHHKKVHSKTFYGNQITGKIVEKNELSIEECRELLEQLRSNILYANQQPSLERKIKEGSETNLESCKMVVENTSTAPARDDIVRSALKIAEVLV